MKIKVKMYNTWVEYKNKKEAEDSMLDNMMNSDGAEQARYTYAYLGIKSGRKVIDTDEENY
jgi:hypothetical protein